MLSTGTTLLTRFDLTWDGKAMDIPDRFWNDLTRPRHLRPRSLRGHVGRRRPPVQKGHKPSLFLPGLRSQSPKVPIGDLFLFDSQILRP